MSVNDDNQVKRYKLLAIPVLIVVVFLLGVVFWTYFVEAFSFGAQPGRITTSGKIQPVPIVQGVDRTLQKAPILDDASQAYLDSQARDSTQNPDTGPQSVWRDYVKWWGVLLLLTAGLLLVIKRIVETTNDETSVMHLKGDTDTALRAKGGRG